MLISKGGDASYPKKFTTSNPCHVSSCSTNDFLVSTQSTQPSSLWAKTTSEDSPSHWYVSEGEHHPWYSRYHPSCPTIIPPYSSQPPQIPLVASLSTPKVHTLRILTPKVSLLRTPSADHNNSTSLPYIITPTAISPLSFASRECMTTGNWIESDDLYSPLHIVNCVVNQITVLPYLADFCNSVIEPSMVNVLEYQQLIQGLAKATWITILANDLGRLAHGVGTQMNDRY